MVVVPLINLTIGTSLDSQSLRVFGNEAELLQVLRYLLRQAIKVTPREGEVTVSATITQEHNFVQEDANDIEMGFRQRMEILDATKGVQALEDEALMGDDLLESNERLEVVGTIQIKVADEGPGLSMVRPLLVLICLLWFVRYLKFDCNSHVASSIKITYLETSPRHSLAIFWEGKGRAWECQVRHCFLHAHAYPHFHVTYL